MTDKNTPAFPTLQEHGFNSGMHGMTLRQYAAIKAMQAFITADTSFTIKMETIATLSCEHADALLEALEEK